jgi:hypothetical protein
MANELQYDHYNNTDILYALIRNETGQVLRTSDSVFVDYPTSGSLEDFARDASTPDAGFLWIKNFPDTLSDGLYTIQIKLRAGSTPVYEDLTMASSQGYWNGPAISFNSGVINNPSEDDGVQIETGTI